MTMRIACFLSVLVAIVMALASHPVRAEFQQRYYVGLSGGVSLLSPDTGDSGYVLDEDQGTGFKVLAGWDITERWSVEGHYAELGDATVIEGDGLVLNPPTGDVSYSTLGLVGLYHFYNLNGGKAIVERSGLDVFLRAGVGSLDTGSETLLIEQLEDFHLMVGLGVEYGWSRNLGLRLDIDYFDEDAQFVSLGAIWRFGSRDTGTTNRRATTPPAAETSAPATAASGSNGASPSAASSQSIPPTAAPSVSRGRDSDRDGVPDNRDACPSTVPGFSVDSRGCPLFEGPLDGVAFVSGSAELTPTARRRLDRLADSLVRSPTISVAIMAHTDNQGSAQVNLQLSRQRALTVARYLASRGVRGERLKPEAYGESKPIASNATEAGRQQNRRIELRTLR